MGELLGSYGGGGLLTKHWMKQGDSAFHDTCARCSKDNCRGQGSDDHPGGFGWPPRVYRQEIVVVLHGAKLNGIAFINSSLVACSWNLRSNVIRQG